MNTDKQATSLFDLYILRREKLFEDIDQQEPHMAADRIVLFIENLERPYTDMSVITDTQARFVHLILNIIAATPEILTAVDASASVPRNDIPETDTSTSKSGIIKQGLWMLFFPKLRKIYNTRSSGELYLWGITVTCILSIFLVLLSQPSIASIFLFFVIGILAVMGATTVQIKATYDLIHHSPPEPKVSLFLRMSIIDGRLSAALRSADKLLEVIKSLDNKDAKPILFEQDRILELLQAISAHTVVSTPEKTVEDLAADSLRLLRVAHIKLVEYSDNETLLFDEQPAGISNHRMLLPALVYENGSLIRKGIVLVPVS